MNNTIGGAFNMRLFKMAALTVFAIFAITAVAASVANAEEFGVLSTLSSFTSTGGTSKLVTLLGKEISCTALTNKGSLETKDLGKATITFTGCSTEAGKVKCKTGSEAAGTISIETVVHIVDIELNSQLLWGILLLLPSTGIVITCGVLKIEVKGAVIGEATEYKETSTTEAFKAITMPAAGTAALVLIIVVKIVFAQTKGDQNITTCHLLKTICEGKTYRLEANFGSGFESAGEESVDEVAPEAGKVWHVDY